MQSRRTYLSLVRPFSLSRVDLVALGHQMPSCCNDLLGRNMSQSIVAANALDFHVLLRRRNATIVSSAAYPYGITHCQRNRYICTCIPSRCKSSFPLSTTRSPFFVTYRGAALRALWPVPRERVIRLLRGLFKDCSRLPYSLRIRTLASSNERRLSRDRRYPRTNHGKVQGIDGQVSRKTGNSPEKVFRV